MGKLKTGRGQCVARQRAQGRKVSATLTCPSQTGELVDVVYYKLYSSLRNVSGFRNCVGLEILISLLDRWQTRPRGYSALPRVWLGDGETVAQGKCLSSTCLSLEHYVTASEQMRAYPKSEELPVTWDCWPRVIGDAAVIDGIIRAMGTASRV